MNTNLSLLCLFAWAHTSPKHLQTMQWWLLILSIIRLSDDDISSNLTRCINISSNIIGDGDIMFNFNPVTFTLEGVCINSFLHFELKHRPKTNGNNWEDQPFFSHWPQRAFTNQIKSSSSSANLQPNWRYPNRLLALWNFKGKSTSKFLLQKIYLQQYLQEIIHYHL